MLKKEPHIYQINTWIWLHTLRENYGDDITLGTIPDTELDYLAALHVDAIWLMGIWKRSPNGVRVAREHPGLQQEYHRALPDFEPSDVVGSPYSIADYTVDPHLGTRDQLLDLRHRLRERGLGLILDYVPNHVATDHPWTEQYPAYLIQGTARERAEHPDDFFAVGDHVFAYGRDPYFPAWTDTAQVNAFNRDFRQAAIELLLEISLLCDGIRCDMAMLLTTGVFHQTWGDRAGAAPETEFWMEIIPAVKAQHPDFVFIAEVYWNMEAELHQQGFDYCYDKSLYDHLEHGDVSGIRGSLQAPITYQRKLVRFIENHDEPRAAHAFGFNRAWMAALLIATLPGAKLWHEGQFVGHQVKLPVQLGRRPHEPDDQALHQFYDLLLKETTTDLYRNGTWRLCAIHQAWEDNHTHQQLIAFTWHRQDEVRLIVVNYASTRAQGKIYLVLPGLRHNTWRLRDLINNKAFEREGHDMSVNGLFIDLDAWTGHLFVMKSL